jgi:hypothetical protein
MIRFAKFPETLLKHTQFSFALDRRELFCFFASTCGNDILSLVERRLSLPLTCNGKTVRKDRLASRGDSKWWPETGSVSPHANRNYKLQTLKGAESARVPKRSCKSLAKFMLWLLLSTAKRACRKRRGPPTCQPAFIWFWSVCSRSTTWIRQCG